MAKKRISIARIGTNQTVNFINTDMTQKTGKVGDLDLLAIHCSSISDNKTTYVRKREWVVENDNFRFPPYVDCDYVE